MFSNDAEVSMFLDVLKDTIHLEGVECHGYVLRKKEAHLIIHTPLGNLSDAMRHLFSVYSQRFNRLNKHQGSLFKDRYKAILIDPEKYLVECSRYLHQLPEIGRKVGDIDTYPWSSFLAYAGEEERPFWLKVRSVLSQFPKPSETMYKNYVLNECNEGLYRFFKRKKLTPYLCSNDFLLAAKNSARMFDGVLLKQVSMDVIVTSTAQVMNESIENIISSKRGRGNNQLGRSVAMYVCRHVGQHSIKSIAAHFCVTHESTVSVRVARFKKLLHSRPDIQKTVQLLIQTAGKFRLNAPVRAVS